LDDQLAKTFSETIFEGNPMAPASFDIALSRKDIDLATELGCRLNVPMPIAAMVGQFMVHTMNRGWSEQSTASLFRLQEEAAGIEVASKPSKSITAAISPSPSFKSCLRYRPVTATSPDLTTQSRFD
jgi:hypothetical protein